MDLNNQNSPNEHYASWHAEITKVLDRHMPVRKMRVREKDAPYITAEWKEAIRKKRKFAKRHKRLQTEESLEKMRYWRNTATRLRRRAIKNYWRAKADDLKENPRSFYKAFAPFMNNKGKGEKDIMLKVGGNIVQDQYEVAETLAEYFSKIADNIGDIPESNQINNHASVINIKKKWNDNSFKFSKIKQDEVLETLKKINPNKATGFDLIPPRALKLAAKEVVTPLTLIYNQVIEQKEWPKDWKRGEWTPVHKKDDPLSKENYRPVTVLNSVDKIFEQLLCQQLKELSEATLDVFMSAYRSKYSCETTLIRLVEDWKRSLDRNETVAVLSTDMSKAFDSMYPPLLLAKLESYGLSRSSITLLESYFKDRENRVRIGNTISDWKSTDRGCPQGSALGPALWNLYQNDLFYEQTISQLSMYADDHQLYSSNQNVEEVINTLEQDGMTTAEWYRRNYLKGNLDKYKAMVMTRQKHEQNIRDVVIDNTNIQQEKNFKLLGVTLDKELNFTDHISSICTTTSRKIGVLTRMRKLIPIHAKLRIYKSAILPHFDYCNLVWHFCKVSDKNKLERINERGLRAVYCDYQSPYEELLKRAKLTTLYNRRLQNIGIFMYKIKNKLLPQTVIDLFSSPSHKYNLRNTDFSTISYNTVTYGRNSLRYLGPFLWTKFSSALRSSTSLQIFKNGIRKLNLTKLVNQQK